MTFPIAARNRQQRYQRPENVLVTSGSRSMLFYALVALIERGDEVLVPAPAPPIYDSVVRFAQGRPVHYWVDPGRPTNLDPDEIAGKISERTRVLILNTPHNPTGAVTDAATLSLLADLVARHDLMVVSDEVHSRLVFEGSRWPRTRGLPASRSRRHGREAPRHQSR